jgi:peptidoglycan/LPS O-acetylase OafA/YrhL
LLDTLRIFAATAVFLGHTNFKWFFGNNTIGPRNGQDYVIIFFVLSGFVIAWSVDNKKNLTFYQYAFDRLTRLWSVALPALFIGVALDLWGKSINPETYQHIFSASYVEAKVLLSSIFMHECWFLSVRPGSNGPFWSLSYEFLYYMIFGSIILLPTLKSKLILGLVWILIAGPKILLLFPCWLIGCLTYYGCKSFRLNMALATFFALLSGYFLITTMALRWHNWSPWGYEGLGTPPLFYSAKYLDDYTIAGALALFLFSMNYWFSLEKKSCGFLSSIIRKCANCSFSLYAIHFPIMAFLGALWASGSVTRLGYVSGIIFVLGICFLFAIVFELPLKKYRSILIRIFPILNHKCGIRS